MTLGNSLDICFLFSGPDRADVLALEVTSIIRSALCLNLPQGSLGASSCSVQFLPQANCCWTRCATW
jgi:hypothetical protein